MRPLYTIITATLLFAVPCVNAQILSGPIANPDNNHLYYLTQELDWFSAENVAIGLGGHLVTINDATENAWVFNTFSTYGGADRFLWIGLNDIAQEGNYVWISGESSAYLNWSPIEPNDGQGIFLTEDVVGIWNSTSGFPLGSWNDAQDFLAYSGVIEVVPEPATTSLLAMALGLAFVRSRRRR